MYFNNYKFLPVEISVSPTIFVTAKNFVGAHLFLFEFVRILWKKFIKQTLSWGPKAQRKIRIENMLIHF